MKKKVSKKLFTLEEANKLLPKIEAEVLQLQQLKQEFKVHYRELQRKKATLGGGDSLADDPYFELETTLEFLNIQARGTIKRIHQTGAQLKDVELGLVDFPGRLNGEEVLFCWRLGEKKICYWHHVWEGFIYRKVIPNS